jgi:hypothetical protein
MEDSFLGLSLMLRCMYVRHRTIMDEDGAQTKEDYRLQPHHVCFFDVMWCCGKLISAFTP